MSPIIRNLKAALHGYGYELQATEASRFVSGTMANAQLVVERLIDDEAIYQSLHDLDRTQGLVASFNIYRDSNGQWRASLTQCDRGDLNAPLSDMEQRAVAELREAMEKDVEWIRDHHIF